MIIRQFFTLDDGPQLSPSRKHRKIKIRHFAAESLALVFRRIPSSGMSQVGVSWGSTAWCG